MRRFPKTDEEAAEVLADERDFPPGTPEERPKRFIETEEGAGTTRRSKEAFRRGSQREITQAGTAGRSRK